MIVSPITTTTFSHGLHAELHEGGKEYVNEMEKDEGEIELFIYNLFNKQV